MTYDSEDAPVSEEEFAEQEIYWSIEMRPRILELLGTGPRFRYILNDHADLG